MRTTRIIAWAALAGLLVVGPMAVAPAVTSSSAGTFHHPILGAAVASSDGGALTFDLAANGFTAEGLEDGVRTVLLEGGAYEATLDERFVPYLVVSEPDSLNAALVKVADDGTTSVLAVLRRVRTLGGRYLVGIRVIDRERPDGLLIVPTIGRDDGMGLSRMTSAGNAGAILYAAGLQL